ncbi:MAG: protein phosphatase 2C domain-containing protein [Zoogloeaceae bacterium]|jgi:serine/threonine protein phosphatase PrpC|nr:protein phosphatase 2C domain-containing protein [Zoogloeaceae bacterium]
MNEKVLRNQRNKVKPEFQKQIKYFLDGLFRNKTTPFFDRGKMSLPDIADFIENEEAQFTAFKFIEEARHIWETQFPGKKMPISQLPEQTEPKPGDTQAPVSKDISATTTISTVSTLEPGHVLATTIPSAKASDQPPPRFHLPNCTVGKRYNEKIEGTATNGKPVRVVDIIIDAALGLKFEKETQIVSGEPTIAGEFSLTLRWTYQGANEEIGGICLLISNPDPRSLWKVVEPEQELPYHKFHHDKKMIRSHGFTIAAASRRGRSHEHSGSFRDDDFFIEDNSENGWSVLLVADGAGSAKSSRQGSLLAVRTAGAHMVSHLDGEFGNNIASLLNSWESAQKEIGEKFHYFFHETASLAVKSIEQEAESKNAPPKDYATTLLAAAVRREGAQTFLATFWMGDGAIAAYGPRGKVRLMGTPDGGEFAGQTRFLDRNALSDQDFKKRVRIGKLPDISAILLMTDGVSDPYFETDNGLADPAKWDALWDEIYPLLNDAAPDARLLEWLHFFKPGHHDDRTIALLW